MGSRCKAQVVVPANSNSLNGRCEFRICIAEAQQTEVLDACGEATEVMPLVQLLVF